MKHTAILFFFILLSCILNAQRGNVQDSGGPLLPEQAAFDVGFYDLDLEVMPDSKTIAGTLSLRAKVVQPLYQLVLDLDKRLQVEQVMEAQTKRSFSRKGNKIYIDLGQTRQAGETIAVAVQYSGKPRIAPNPPWDGGFQWAKTPSREHWIATSCQTNGADLWWPCKDHVSDEPDSMALHITVPKPLVVASNGRLKGSEDKGSKTTWHWDISTPINIYNVALNIAPYKVVRDELQSVAGDVFPIEFYVLPKDYLNGQQLMPEIKEHLQFYEKYLGPYPFRADKYGVAQTPHLGMEHQTIIAYGADFDNTSMTRGTNWGFDALHHHELGHEWWGNLVTNFDWRDMWIHEGFCTYMQALYMEDKKGKDAYHAYMNSLSHYQSMLALAPRATRSAKEIYQAPIYSNGAWVLHSLRHLMGDDAFFVALRKMCYPSKEMEQVTDGTQCRFVTTDDFINICEAEYGQELDWFFDVYCRQPVQPQLNSRVKGNTITLSWDVPDGLPFPMPVPVQFGDEIKRINVTTEAQTITFEAGIKPEVDPQRALLYKLPF